MARPTAGVSCSFLCSFCFERGEGRDGQGRRTHKPPIAALSYCLELVDKIEMIDGKETYRIDRSRA